MRTQRRCQYSRYGAAIGAASGLLLAYRLLSPLSSARPSDEPGLESIFLVMYCIVALVEFVGATLAGWVIGAFIGLHCAREPAMSNTSEVTPS